MDGIGLIEQYAKLVVVVIFAESESIKKNFPLIYSVYVREERQGMGV